MLRPRDVSLACAISDNSQLSEGYNTLGSSVATAEVCSQTYDLGRGREKRKGILSMFHVPDLRTGCLSKQKNENTTSCPNEKSENTMHFLYFITAF